MVVSPCDSWFSGSVDSRPAYRMSGAVLALAALYPRAMFPLLSTARAPIQRLSPSAALFQICCCTGVVAIVPPVTFICAHCIPAGEVVNDAPVVWLTHSDSVPPMLRY